MLVTGFGSSEAVVYGWSKGAWRLGLSRMNGDRVASGAREAIGINNDEDGVPGRGEVIESPAPSRYAMME